MYCPKNNGFMNLLLRPCIVIFEMFVKSMTSCLSELKVAPSFCFAFKIPDDLTATSTYVQCTAHWEQKG